LIRSATRPASLDAIAVNDRRHAGLPSTPIGKLVYVAARGTNQLVVVSAGTNAVVQSVPVGLRPHGVVFNPENARIYVTNRGGCNSVPGTVSVIDSRTRSVLATVPVGTCPRFLDLERDAGFLYVPNAYTSRSVSVIQDEE
jgi:YVTN family beta-propeller protein